MPIDWTEYLATNKTEDYIADKGGTRVQKSSNAKGDLIARIIEVQFPEISKSINTKISPEKAADGALAEYGGLAGDVIKLGKLSAPMSTSTYLTGKQKGQSWNGDGAYLDTSQVIDGVASAMHEIYHARAATVRSVGYANDPTLGKNWKEMLIDAGKADFPSVDTAIGGGDRLEEFLATATTIANMRSKNMNITEGRMKGLPEALDKLSVKYPWVPGFIKANMSPTPKLKEKSKGLVGSLLDLLN